MPQEFEVRIVRPAIELPRAFARGFFFMSTRFQARVEFEASLVLERPIESTPTNLFITNDVRSSRLVRPFPDPEMSNLEFRQGLPSKRGVFWGGFVLMSVAVLLAIW